MPPEKGHRKLIGSVLWRRSPPTPFLLMKLPKDRAGFLYGISGSSGLDCGSEGKSRGKVYSKYLFYLRFRHLSEWIGVCPAWGAEDHMAGGRWRGDVPGLRQPPWRQTDGRPAFCSTACLLRARYNHGLKGWLFYAGSPQAALQSVHIFARKGTWVPWY